MMNQLIYTSCMWNCLSNSIWRFLTSSCIDFCTDPKVSSSVRWTNWSENDEVPCCWSTWPGWGWDETPCNSNCKLKYEAITGHKSHINDRNVSIITLVTGRIPITVIDGRSCLANRLPKRSSLVSSPVFFDFGELIVEDDTSAREEVTAILSA